MLTTAKQIWFTIRSSSSLNTTWKSLALGPADALNEMCGMMLRDQLSGTLNPTIDHSIEKFPDSSSKKTTEHNLYNHNPTKGRLAIYTSFVEAFWPLTWRAWCKKSSVRAPLCMSHNRPGLVTLLKISRLAKSCRKFLGSCTPTTFERHWSHSASSCSKPRARQAALKVGCTTMVGVWGRWVVLKSSKHVAPTTWVSKTRR